MSVQFNDTTNYKGLVQLYEKEIGANLADVSGSTTKLKEFTADVNLALDDFTKLAIEASGTWQFDDSGHSAYPIITTNLVDGQRDYSFTTDEQGNLILDIYKVAILGSATATVYDEITPIDAQSTPYNNFVRNDTTEGVPYCYDKTANSIFLDPIPSYNATNGLKIYINREASYFTSSDTTKKPGVPGIFHKYFALRPAEDYLRRNQSPKYPSVRAERMQMEADIKAYFGRRERDVRKVLSMAPINFR